MNCLKVASFFLKGTYDLNLYLNLFANAGANVTLFHAFQSFLFPFFNLYLTLRYNPLEHFALESKVFFLMAMGSQSSPPAPLQR